jgi:hypothetical protein
VVPPVTATGLANCNVCQPLAVSPVNVPVANWAPDTDHNVPVCVPVFAAAL